MTEPRLEPDARPPDGDQSAIARPLADRGRPAARSLERVDPNAAASGPRSSTVGLVRAPLSRRVLVLMLTALLAGGTFLWSSFDVKQESSVPASGIVEMVEDEIVVDLVDDASEAAIAALGSQLGIQLRYNSVHSRQHKLMVATIDPARRDAIVAALRASTLVEAADPNYLRAPFAPSWTPNDPYFPQQWHLRMLRMEEAWAYTKGAGAVVAVIDTGVGASDPQQWRRLGDFQETTFVTGFDFASDDDIPEDGNGHGTHVAGTIAESTNNDLMGAGVAPEASIMPLRVIGQRGATDADIADAVRFAADHGAHVANLSLGGPAKGTVIEAAFDYAVSKDVTLVCAAGNDGRRGVSFPARLPTCIAVSAVGTDQRITPYSNHGPEIDLAAPGGDMRAGASGGIWQNTLKVQRGGSFSAPKASEGFFALEGTSMASPHVSGVAALLVSAGIKKPDEIRALLRRAATSAGSEEQYGAGIVDAAAAVAATGLDPNQRYYKWIALAGGAVLALLFLGTNHLIFSLIFVAIGSYLPTYAERFVEFGSLWNLAGHSMLFPLLWLLRKNLSSASVVCASSLAVGLGAHFALDLYVGTVPFAVTPASRVKLWFSLNLMLVAAMVVAQPLSNRTSLVELHEAT